MEHGYLLKKTNGDVWQTDLWQAGMGILDVTNPDARVWYCGYLRKILRMGVDCLKTDFGERIPREGHCLLRRQGSAAYAQLLHLPVQQDGV